jgi:hypothetical protein
MSAYELMIDIADSMRKWPEVKSIEVEECDDSFMVKIGSDVFTIDVKKVK